MSDFAKKNILARLYQALKNPTDKPFPNITNTTDIFKMEDEDLDISFAQQFKAIGGQFVFCENTAELAEQ